MSTDAESRAAGPGDATSASDSSEVPDDIREFGKYHVQRVLGAGGMGAVYRAVDTQLRRTVALKILPRERAENPILVRRFQSEAQAAAALRHENIVTVYEAGTANGYLYIALELVEGRDVHEILSENPGSLDVAKTIDVTRQAATALQHAYEQGIVHRDIKPSNLLLDEKGVVKLTDMGLARSVDETTETGITRAGTTVGTVDYMAPEQARSSKAADVRSDVYSLGCTWFHMLTGHVPFPKGSVTNKLMAHAARERPDPRKTRPAVPEQVVRVLHKMMARSPKERYQTPSDLLDDLDRLVDLDVATEDADFARRLAEANEAPESNAETLAEQRETRSEPKPKRRRSSKGSGRQRRPAGSRGGRSRKKGVHPGVIVALVLVVGGVVGFGVWSSSGRPDPVEVTENETTPGEPGDEPAVPRDDDPTEPAPQVETPDPPPPPRVTFDIGRTTEQSELPRWLAEVTSMDEEPAWELPSVGVAVGPSDAAQYRDLGRALDTTPGEGRVIRLLGPGPFVLTPPAPLAGNNHVVIVGDAERRPLVRVVSDDPRATDDLLNFVGTSLTLLDVDLEIDASHLADGPALSVRDGDLVMRRCSVTVRTGRPTSVVSVAGRVAARGPEQPRSPRVLLDRVVVRADASDVLTLAADGVDALAWNCLLASQAGAAVRLDAASTASTESPNRVDVFSSTLFTNGLAVALDSPTGDAPPTRLRFHNSLVGTRSSEATLLSATGWPLDGDENRFQLRSVEWTTVATAYFGWRTTVRVQAADGERTASGYSGWRRTIDRNVHTAQFPASRWPSMVLESVPTESPATFDPESNPKPSVRGDDGELVGADVGRLAVGAPRVQALADDLALRPTVPPPVTAADAVPALEIDAADDVGRTISESNLRDGALVVVTGSGKHVSRPIFVADKSIRIEFRPDGDEELVLRVRGDRITDEDARRGRKNAFVSVKNGSVEIVNGLFEIPSATVGTPIEWFLHAEDASFTLRRTEVRGPVLPIDVLRSMFHCVRSEDTDVQQTAAFEDSYVLTTTPLLEGDLRRRSIVVEDSVLVSRGTLFEGELNGVDPHLGTRISLRDSTLATEETVFEFHTEEVPGGVSEPIRCFVDSCVFGPPAEFGPAPTRGPVFYAAAAAAGRQSQVRWLGRDNAFWEGFHAFVVGTGENDPPRQSVEAWQTPWGDRVVRPLSGPEAVRYLDGPPRSRDARRASFQLSPHVKAATWRLDGGPVGADASITQSRE